MKDHWIPRFEKHSHLLKDTVFNLIYVSIGAFSNTSCFVFDRRIKLLVDLHLHLERNNINYILIPCMETA